MSILRTIVGGISAVVLVASGAAAVQSGDAYVKQNGNQWTFGTASVERTVVLEGGKFLSRGFKNKVTGAEIAVSGGEFSFASGGEQIGGETGGWTLVGSKTDKLSMGELQLDIALGRGALQVTKSYVIYPKSSIIREWLTFKNAGEKPVQVVEPSFLDTSVNAGRLPDLHWMTGGECVPGTWEMKSETLSGKPRTFDSYEPFPTDRRMFQGDGVNAKIMLNDTQIWPKEGWQYVADATTTVPFDVSADVKPGDRLLFIVNMNKSVGWDTTAFDPTIAYDGGESHTASKEFSTTQGKDGWRYQCFEGGKLVDLVYYSDKNQWRAAKDTPLFIPFVGVNNQHPDDGRDSARVWTASNAGHVRITGSVCNTGNGQANGSYGFRPGSGTYAPWYALYDNKSKSGLFIGWDYFGHWRSSFDSDLDGVVRAQLRIAGHKQTLAPGESFSTPKAFIGLYKDDIDNAGNECLDWQYRYMWDYTRKGWFPAIRMLGFWWNGTTWGATSWTGGQPDWDSCFRKIFRVSDLMRYVGADVYHRDWGWWDKAGDWNGPDFRTTGNYLRKSGMGQLIYAFIYTVEAESKVAKEHPEWLIGGTLDMSKPEVVEHLKRQLDTFVQNWGTFEWRNDSFFTTPKGGDDTVMLGQDQGFRAILKSFLDKHPDCAFQAVNGGGNYGGYDYTRMCSSFSFSDGADAVMRNYWAALLFPPDKTSDIPDAWNPNAYDKASWRGLLCINFDMTGDTWDPEKLEGLRELIDIYHYLEKQGVVGRWVKVYRPTITGDDPTMYFQRMSGDQKRGIIIPKHKVDLPITIKPKGLLPRTDYIVSFHESKATETRKGAELMANGIKIGKMLPGELIYLNLPMHPGSKLDTTPPTAPTGISKQSATNMGYPGVELTWGPGKDDNWVSYYEISRDGKVIDKVAKGTYYFDHSAGSDIAAKYEVRTVDGAGNKSAPTATPGPEPDRAKVYDDSPASGMTYTGAWEHKFNLLPAHEGSISFSNTKGDTVELAFEGSEVMWYTKLGADCGLASVTIDNGAPETVDTYSADDIWGVCVYHKTIPAGRHTLRIHVTGDQNRRAKGSAVYVDGVKVIGGK